MKHQTSQFRWTPIALALALSVSGSTPTGAAESEAYSVARGGRLYDNWFKVSEDAQKPTGPHPSYPETGKYRGDKGNDWRCKECHGWDYLGSAGAYGSGKHQTGIKGIQGMRGADPEKIATVLKDQTHAYADTSLTDLDYRDLSLFVSRGQIDMSAFADSKTKKAKGDSALGKGQFETICANCHGLDGKGEKDMEPLGEVATDNPWEAVHKMTNGQPGEDMPALRALDPKVVADILAHMQTLPTSK